MAKSPADKNNNEAAWIRELAQILDETGLTEIEVDKSDIKVRVARAPAPVAAVAPAAAVAAPAVAPQEPTATIPSGKPAQDDKPPAGSVLSPMVGTVYLSPSPDSAPFVKPGDAVTEGQTVMIIEAMKTMNPVTAASSGKVKSILVQNEQPVEFGEPLIVIE
ncbi:MAG: acetyl-CoA carboxylase biotin carboxyl carrier protein [Pseudomonadota bacterium]